MKSTYLEIQDGGQPPNFQSLNGYNSGVHGSISLKFSTEFQHVTANTWFKVKGSMVKVTAYVTANTDSRQICLVFLLIYRVTAWAHGASAHHAIARGGRRLHAAVARRTSQNVRKQYFQIKQTRKTQNVWRDVVRPSRCNAFAIAHFLV